MWWQNYTLFDQFFQSTYGGVMINHLYMVSAQVALWNSTTATAGPCPTSITQNYIVNGSYVNTTTTGLYATSYLDSDGLYLPKNDNSIFTPDCHVVENISSLHAGQVAQHAAPDHAQPYRHVAQQRRRVVDVLLPDVGPGQDVPDW